MPRRKKTIAPRPHESATGFVVALLGAALAAVAYANSLANGFVWDDGVILTRQLVVFRSVADVLVPPRGIPQFSPDYYRPVVIASYLIDRAIGGDAPLAYHVSMVLTHALVTALTGLLAWTLFAASKERVVGSLVAAGIFAVHPVHTESVAWAAGRSDVLAAAFLLATLVVHARGPSSWRRTTATGIFAALALGSKEAAVAVLPLILLYDLVTDGRAPSQHGSRMMPVRYAGPLAGFLVYLLLRRAALGELIGHAPADPGLQRSLVDLVGACAAYVGKLIWPVNLNAYIDHVPRQMPVLLLVPVAALATLGAIAWLWRAGRRVPVFCVLWVGLTLFPALAIVWKIPEAPMAERYLYLPSVGFCLLLGYGVMRAWEHWPRFAFRTALACVVVAVLCAGFALTVQRNRVWRDNIALWSDAAAKSRVSGMALRSLAAAHLEAGRPQESQRYFEQALLRRNGKRGEQIIYTNLGTIALQSGDYVEAERYYRKALGLGSPDPDTLFNLGLAVLERGGRTAEAAAAALQFYRQAEQLSPHDPDIQAALGQVFLIRGEPQRARGHMQRALELGVRRETAEGVRRYLRRLDEEGVR